jgi:hypothetical protein
VLIVDPASDTVIASGHSLVGQNPLWHAAMVGIDLVARSQGGSMWNFTGKKYVPPTHFPPIALTLFYVFVVFISFCLYVCVKIF